MRIAAALVVVALGCSEPSKPTANVRYLSTGLVQTQFPFLFAIALANHGSAPATVDGVRFDIQSTTLLYDDAAGAPPAGFKCSVGLIVDVPNAGGPVELLPPGESLTIAPGESRNVYGVVQWNLPDEAPPMLAIVSAAFAPLHDGKPVVETGSLVMFIQSRPGALRAVRESQTTNAQQARQVVAGLRAIQGKHTPDFEDLIRQIEAVAKREN